MTDSSDYDQHIQPSRDSRIRQQVLFVSALMLTIAWCGGMVITHMLSPFSTTALVGVTTIGAIWVALCFLTFRQNPQHQASRTRLSNFTVGFLFFSIFALTMENLFGQQTTLLLSDKTPTAAFGYSFAILIAFCLLRIRQAIWASSLFTAVLMIMLSLHMLIYAEQYESFYVPGLLAGVIFLLCPVNIALLYGFHRVMHAEIESADREIEQSTRAYKKAALSAKQDSLTGILNRFGMWEELDKAYAITPSLGIITIRLSNESQLGDYLGSRSMDQLYRQMARILATCAESESEFARREGGEFVLWYSYLKDNAELEKIGNRMLKLLSEMSMRHWKGRPEFSGAGRVCSDDRPPSRVLEETQFLIQFGKSTNIAFSTL